MKRQILSLRSGATRGGLQSSRHRPQLVHAIKRLPERYFRNSGFPSDSALG
ncbi:MAG TPA: hypothetical protein VJN18_34455 [Polyangiaceae bacterium]|nr:hypothetical protein [Polyangiaceae bacterium]